MNPHHEAKLLFFISDGEPVFQQDDARTNQHPLEFGHILEELFYLVLRGKTHDPLDAGAVIPGPVEQHYFSASRQMRHIALEIPL